jgi:putative flippase GtrA
MANRRWSFQEVSTTRELCFSTLMKFLVKILKKINTLIFFMAIAKNLFLNYKEGSYT